MATLIAVDVFTCALGNVIPILTFLCSFFVFELQERTVYGTCGRTDRQTDKRRARCAMWPTIVRPHNKIIIDDDDDDYTSFIVRHTTYHPWHPLLRVIRGTSVVGRPRCLRTCWLPAAHSAVLLHAALILLLLLLITQQVNNLFKNYFQ